MDTINKHLKPLFLTNLFAGMMFYYAILFPFLSQSGITAAQIALIISLASIVQIAFEFTTGILADRWSRKYVLMVGFVALALSTLLYAVSHSFTSFLIAETIACIYFAARSGIYEAMLYDTLTERNDRKNYERYLGKMRAYYATGSVTGSLTGAAVAHFFNFPVVFYMSTILCVVVIFLLSRFNEPQLHRQQVKTDLIPHIKSLLSLLSHSREMKLLVFTSIFVGINLTYMMALDRLWPVALGLSTIWFGPLNAFLLSSPVIAGLLAGRAAKNNNYLVLVSFALILSTLGLLVQNIFIIVLSEFMLLGTSTILTILLSGKMQDKLPPSQRSGAESVISIFTILAFTGSVVIFSYITKHHSVFSASWVLVAVALVSILGVSASLHRREESRQVAT